MEEKRIVWVHGDCLSPLNPALLHYPEAAAVYVWDEALLTEWQISLKRIMFMYECLLELPVTIRRGDVVAEVTAFAKEHGATMIATTESVSPRFEVLRQTFEAQGLPVEVHRVLPFVDYEGDFDLKRHSRYWRVARKYAMQPTAN